MQKFVKKNIEVQAIQYDGMPESLEELTALGLQYRLKEDSSISIITSHGEVNGEIGDYILMSEVTGDFEICNQDKFQKLYSAETLQNTLNEDISDAEIKTASIENSEEKEVYNKEQLCIPEKRNSPTSFYNWVQPALCLLQFLLLIIFPFVMNSMVQKSIKITVESIYQEEIHKESELLLEKTKVESLQIIEQAKKDAVIEADEAFRKEMERLTKERMKK